MKMYPIPMRQETGRFRFSELNTEKEGESLDLCYDSGNELLTYDVPVYGNEARIYMVSEDRMPDGLTAVYGDSGRLDRVELMEEDRSRLIYIGYPDNETAEEAVRKFVEGQADQIFAGIIDRKQKLARLFLETFYDGEAVEMAVRTATAEEMQAVVDAYDDDPDAADNGGNYPMENLIMADNETLGIMLMCADCDFQDTLFEQAVEIFGEQIRNCFLNKIEKTEDFQFIAEEVD